MRIFASTDRAAMGRLFRRRASVDPAIKRRAAAIVGNVRSQGDRALVRYARQLDGLTGSLEVSSEEMKAGAARLDGDLRTAIAVAARNIARVAKRQIPRGLSVRVAAGVSIEQRVVPLGRVGCYVPGGRFPLASSLLMTAVPARVAGVKDIVAVCPKPDAAVMSAALEAGVSRLFRVGGAHAVAALAYGTPTIPRVDKIVGPGNRYVAEAKALVARDCPIDFTAGPTEIVIVAASGKPAWIAADLVAQAEHDPDAQAILITWSRTFARSVAAAVAAAVADLTPRNTVAARSLARNGAIVVTPDADTALAVANQIGSEHLVVDRDRMTKTPLIAGTVFVGPYAAQAAGDYATGSNHVLPTSGSARSRGGLSAADFVRVMSVQRMTRDGLARLSPAILPLARAEGLEAHARSVEIRISRRSSRRGHQSRLGQQRP